MIGFCNSLCLFHLLVVQDFLVLGGGREGMDMTHKPCCKRMKAMSRKLIGQDVDVDRMSQAVG